MTKYLRNFLAIILVIKIAGNKNMTKYLRNFLAIILVIEIAGNNNSTSAFPSVTFPCLGERKPFEVSSCNKTKYLCKLCNKIFFL